MGKEARDVNIGLGGAARDLPVCRAESSGFLRCSDKISFETGFFLPDLA